MLGNIIIELDIPNCCTYTFVCLYDNLLEKNIVILQAKGTMFFSGDQVVTTNILLQLYISPQENTRTLFPSIPPQTIPFRGTHE